MSNVPKTPHSDTPDQKRIVGDTGMSNDKLRQELFKIVEPAVFHHTDKSELDRALDNLETLIAQEATKAIKALIDSAVVEGRIDELESNRNQIGFDVGWIHLTKDDVDDRISELKATKEEDTNNE